MASPIRPILPRRQPPALTEDLLEEIFLRIASPADLARASTACAAFRRLIADPTFLRRYRSLHPPLLLGFVARTEGFQPAEAPHPGARAADFSFDHLPPGRGGPWCVCDVRDGRVLLESRFYSTNGDFAFSDFAACDPVSRRYLLLPPISDDLLASVQVEVENVLWLQGSLVPSGDEDDETSFRVIGRALCDTKSVVFVFSSASGLWIAGATVLLLIGHNMRMVASTGMCSP